MKKNINFQSQNSESELASYLENHIKENLIIICIGTDKFIGDALGPIVGSILTEYNFPFPIFGTIHEPIHALNLNKSLENIKQKYKSSYIIAIDACLGNKSNIGDIYVRDTPISPGKGVGKSLTQVGDLSIVGIVAKSDSEEFLYSNTIRLSLVYDMANVIAKSLVLAYDNWLFRFVKDKKK